MRFLAVLQVNLTGCIQNSLFTDILSKCAWPSTVLPCARLLLLAVNLEKHTCRYVEYTYNMRDSCCAVDQHVRVNKHRI